MIILVTDFRFVSFPGARMHAVWSKSSGPPAKGAKMAGFGFNSDAWRGLVLKKPSSNAVDLRLNIFRTCARKLIARVEGYLVTLSPGPCI